MIFSNSSNDRVNAKPRCCALRRYCMKTWSGLHSEQLDLSRSCSHFAIATPPQPVSFAGFSVDTGSVELPGGGGRGAYFLLLQFTNLRPSFTGKGRMGRVPSGTLPGSAFYEDECHKLHSDSASDLLKRGPTTFTRTKIATLISALILLHDSLEKHAFVAGWREYQRALRLL
jgi:hypothetical protein